MKAEPARAGRAEAGGARASTERTPAQARRVLAQAGRALAAAGLVTAFGHVSARVPGDRLLITPPVPLGTLGPDAPYTEVPLGALGDEAAESKGSRGPLDLPEGTPREAWIHVEIARARPEAGAICRAQPPTATALASAGVPIVPLHGQGAFLGPRVPLFDDAVLVRDRERGRALAGCLGDAPALVMRGNGAVTVGATVGEAVALMWVLEASARMNATAAAAGTPVPITPAEQEAWLAVRAELCGRIWSYLRESS